MKKNAIKWIEALLSGKYKQSRFQLGNEKMGFCCWGLGCFITKTPYNPFEVWNSEFSHNVGFIVGDYGQEELKKELYGQSTLMGINDETTAGFKRIGQFLIKTADLHFKPVVAKAIKEHFKTK